MEIDISTVMSVFEAKVNELQKEVLMLKAQLKQIELNKVAENKPTV